MSIVFRLMREDDLSVVRQIDRDSFGTLHHELTGQADELPLREPEYFAHWLRTDPGGAWVAELEGEVVGLNFNHARGRSGWVGPLAMKPGVQLKGGGRVLCEKGGEYLQSQGCESIGLNTYANNPVSVSLYLKLGFEITGGTLVLKRPIAESLPAIESALRVEQAVVEDVPALARLDESQSGFRRDADLRFALDWETSTVLKLLDDAGTTCGLLVCYQKRGAGMMGSLYLTEAAHAAGGLVVLLEGAHRFYAARGLLEMQLTVEARDLRLTAALFSLGFRTRVAMVRMIRETEVRRGPLRGPLCPEKG